MNGSVNDLETLQKIITKVFKGSSNIIRKLEMLGLEDKNILLTSKNLSDN